MKLKWQWFLGGTLMFWVSIVIFVFLIFAIAFTYLVDPITLTEMKIQNIDTSSIKEISKEYVNSLRYRYRYADYV